LEVKEPSAKYLVGPRYKQSEVGEIPADWSIATLGLIARIKTGRRNNQDKVDDGAYPFFVRSATVERINAFSYECEAILVPGEGGIGSIFHYINGRFEVHQRVYAIRDFAPSVLGKFVYFYMAEHFGRHALRNSVKATVDSLRLPTFKNFPIPLPPTKAEQEVVAEALSHADALIESLEQLLAKKRHLKQGAMQELLTGKKRLPRFSGAWEVKSLGELFTFTGGLSASRDQLSAEGHCYLHYGDIHLSSKSFIDIRTEIQDIPKLKIPLSKVSTNSLLADGDVVFVDASEDDEGASKHVVVVNPHDRPFISGLHTIVAKGKSADLDHRYRRYCFQTRAVRSQFRFFAVGTKVSGISKTNIAKVTIPVPSIAEQSAIAAILSDMDAEVDTLETKLAKARELKQGMMQELLTGRIRLV